MKPVLPLCVFIDACGWEISRDQGFALDIAPKRKRLTSILGYSCACVPAIVSGAWPDTNHHWSYFAYDPARSPFKSLRPLRWLPKAITSRRRFRRYLSKWAKQHLGFQGYFDLYNIPFEHIHLFDFSEKRSPLRPGGMNRGPNLFDLLQRKHIPHHASIPEAGEQENLRTLLEQIRNESIDFAFLYWPDLDGLLHRVGNQAPEIGQKLRQYEHDLRQLLALAANHYSDVRLYLFSDHGMANCERILDLQREINKLPLRMARDYVAVYDSTMARFWFLNQNARPAIEDCLRNIPQGRILPDEELQRCRVFFPDRKFGELIFLVDEGVLIVPSHMGARPLRAMHGYHPDDLQSYAAFMTNQPSIPPGLNALPDLGRFMLAEADLASSVNHLQPAFAGA